VETSFAEGGPSGRLDGGLGRSFAPTVLTIPAPPAYVTWEVADGEDDPSPEHSTLEVHPESILQDGAEVELTSLLPDPGISRTTVAAGTVSGGPNAGTSFAPFGDAGDGSHTTNFVPTAEGTDELTILVNGQR
jgi:hypothetical protein